MELKEGREEEHVSKEKEGETTWDGRSDYAKQHAPAKSNTGRVTQPGNEKNHEEDVLDLSWLS